MTVASGDVLQMVAEFGLPDGVIAQNVFEWVASFVAAQSEAAVIAALGTFAEEFYGAIDDNIQEYIEVRPFQVNSMAFDVERGSWVIEQVLGEVLPDIVFSSTFPQMPNAVAMSLVAKTARPRSNGRKQLPGLTELSVVDNTLQAGILAKLADALGVWLTDVAVTPNNNLIPSIMRKGVGATLPLVSGIVNDIVGSMRTRKPGVGS